MKSCSSTRATTNGTSSVRSPFGCQLAIAAHVVFGDLLAVEVSQHGFQHDANADRQPGNRADAFFFQLRQRIKLASLTGVGKENVWSVLKRLCGMSVQSSDKRNVSVRPFRGGEFLKCRVSNIKFRFDRK